jgi:hypothetical protein
MISCLGVIAVVLIATGAVEFTKTEACDAQRRYYRALSDARDVYLRSLERVMQQAAQEKDADEIGRLAGEIARLKAITDEDQPSGDGRPFRKEDLQDTTVRFMRAYGSDLIQLKRDGSIVPPLQNEYFWRVVDGKLEFIGRDGQTPTTRWAGYFLSDGHAYACARFIPDPTLPNVLAFEKAAAPK